jgi:muramoyltetrapeptide carboxypeptidase LdcA involved in peptidoglycan recycling
MKVLRPPALRPGDTIGVFTPSLPAPVLFREKYQHGICVLERLGFRVVEGEVTMSRTTQGYRSGSPEARARELMALIVDPTVKGLIATMGGFNSSSLIPYLDFDAIRAHPKVLCGYSDITSLHLAFLAHAGLSTFHGPAVVTSFGEWPDMLEETRDAFLAAVSDYRSGARALTPPTRWSNHFRDATTSAWKDEPRKFEEHRGWRVLRPGEVRAPLVIGNLETLLAAAGTAYFPTLEGCILVIEQLKASLSVEERSFRQLERIGVFDVIGGLVVGRPEFFDAEGAPFGYDDLVLEIVGAHGRYPIVTNFDCGHGHPQLTLAQMTEVSVTASEGFDARVVIEEPMVEAPRAAPGAR